MTLERPDIQRILLYGLTRRPHSVFGLFRLESPVHAAAWLGRQLDQRRIPSAQLEPGKDPDPPDSQDYQLFVAFTYAGLERLELDAEALSSFIPEFRQGMIAPHRARVIGDQDSSRWSWGSATQPVHLLCAAYARTRALLPRWEAVPPDGCRLVHRVLGRHSDTEPFGFRDGLSQPYVEGSDRDDSYVPEQDRVPAGEFILGYRNAFGAYPASPCMRPHGRSVDLPTLPLSRLLDFGKNGSFLVARQLAQEVRAFQQLDPVVQACMMGRWQEGKSLTTHPPDSQQRAPIPGPDPTGNEFGYFSEDASGLRCPLGSHVRRANPRDGLADASLNVSPVEALRRANQHRILRSSRRYDEGEESGMFFICFNANIERQFEFVQQTWINSPNFAGPRSETDPVVGNTPGEFTLRAGPDREIVREGLRAFVQVRGGAYFFMPGLRALRYLANLRARSISTTS
jgi:deferrochelatase/peroxidase EfeB